MAAGPGRAHERRPGPPVTHPARLTTFDRKHLHIVKEITAYLGLVVLAVCVLSAGIVASQLTGGVLGLAVGAVAAVLTFLGLRRITGRVVAAAVADL